MGRFCWDIFVGKMVSEVGGKWCRARACGRACVGRSIGTMWPAPKTRRKVRPAATRDSPAGSPATSHWAGAADANSAAPSHCIASTHRALPT